VPKKTESGRLDPYSISIYTLKELILREWREEWEAKPSNPSSIRLINFGRVLEDSYVLKGMCLLSFLLLFFLGYVFRWKMGEEVLWGRENREANVDKQIVNLQPMQRMWCT
jgi:hypothetical protein